jgi:hypothetical protein
MQTCGRPTKAGNPCGWREDPCEWHGPWPERPAAAEKRAPLKRAGRAPAPPITQESQAPVEPADGDVAPSPPDAIASRNLYELGWWAAGALAAKTLDAARASALATMIRTLHALGEAPESDQQRWGRIALEARLANGLAPGDEAGWELAERVLDPETLAEIRQWA